MPNDFASLNRLYNDNSFEELCVQPDGIYFLKLRSLARPTLLGRLAEAAELQAEEIPRREILQRVFQKRVPVAVLEKLIRQVFAEERGVRQQQEPFIVSQLFRMTHFDWGGLYQNSLERTIVDNYVKKIQNFEELNQKIDTELQASLRGYVLCSWYNHWSSILIEDIFKSHPTMLPTVGLIKKVDFFWHDTPFDLKVTYFPDGYMKLRRKGLGLSDELTELKRFARSHSIHFDKETPENILFPELFAKISEHSSSVCQEFIRQFRTTRRQIVTETLANPKPLARWLYEEQGVRRFDAANRFFLVLIDLSNLEESWKLKRNLNLVRQKVDEFLNARRELNLDSLKLEFEWESHIYHTFSEILFVAKE